MKPRFYMAVTDETGFRQALYGVSLSYRIPNAVDNNAGLLAPFMNLDYQKAMQTAHKLANKDGGHNKFLESIQVSFLISAARYWWQEFDTYRVGVTKQSESSIHTLTRTKLTQNHFAYDIPPSFLAYLNSMQQVDCNIHEKKIVMKNALPEGFLQERMVVTNYKALRNICHQRKNHELPEWQMFIAGLKELSQYSWLGMEDS